MAKVVVLGGGVCGLAAGLMLARDGHEVTLLERDPSPIPDSPEAAWEQWERDGVAQFRQAHILQARGRARARRASCPTSATPCSRRAPRPSTTCG